MKKYTLLFAFCCLFLTSSYAQFVLTPARFGPYEPITIDFDATGTPLAGETEVFIWAWSSGGDAPSNGGGWGNPRPAASALVNVGGNRWRFTMVSTRAFYGIRPNQIGPRINFLIRNRAGNRQTSDVSFPMELPIFKASKIALFPLNYTQDDFLNIAYDQNLENIDAVKNVTPAAYITATFDDGSTSPQVKLNLQGTAKRFNAGFVPSRTFTVPAGRRITAIAINVASTNDATISSGTFSFNSYLGGN